LRNPIFPKNRISLALEKSDFSQKSDFFAKLSTLMSQSDAVQALKDLFSWIDFSQAQWACLRITRAEPSRCDLMLPDVAFAKSYNNVIVVWPTKLTLSPNLATDVVGLLRQQQVSPRYPGLNLLASLPRPKVAQPVWESIF
jgi:hypothetical protein